jgi:hypothetical protein
MKKQPRVILVNYGALVTGAACDEEERSVATDGEGEDPSGGEVAAAGGEGALGGETPPDGAGLCVIANAPL